MSFLCSLITVYIVVVFVRVVLSWFPISYDSPFAPISRVVIDLTEPVMAPLRRVVPAVGMIDLSTMVLIFGLYFLRGILCQ